jgi:hypothetical protein
MHIISAMVFAQFGEGLRIYLRKKRVQRQGMHTYIGSAEEICSQIIYDCYNKKHDYFMTSAGHFSEFYARDFGICTDSLILLGFEKEVQNTLKYALAQYSKYGAITTSINPQGHAFNFPNVFSPDSSAFFFRSLESCADNELLLQYRGFLQKSVDQFHRRVMGKDGLIKSRHFSSMNDHVVRKQSCYDTCMAGMLSRTVESLNARFRLNISNPLAKYDFEQTLQDHYRAYGFFLDDLSGSKHFSSDANIMPYYCGIINEPSWVEQMAQRIEEEKLDQPLPMKYRNGKYHRQVFASWFAKEYEVTTSWAHLGLCYLKLLEKYDMESRIKRYLKSFEEKIDQYRNFLEVLNIDGTPYSSGFYYCDEGMLWSSIWLELKRKYG